jgi:Ca2+-binding RTX toxin-like protein
MGAGPTQELITINNAANFSADGFQFGVWNATTDRIVINGTTAADDLTGSATNDTLNGGNGADTLRGSDQPDRHNGAAGADVFIYASQDQIDGDTIDGGADSDAVQTTNGVAALDFSVASFTGSSGASIERLVFVNTATQQVSFNAGQFGATGVAFTLDLTGAAGTDIIAINGANTFSAANFTFTSWNAATDRVLINGTTGGNDLTGSRERDTISGGAGQDVIRGSEGADRHEGGADSDAFIYSSQVQIDGDTIDGGDGSDELQTASGVATLDFTTATFAGSSGASIDRLSFFNAAAQNVIFNASQFGGAGVAFDLRITGGGAAETITINNAGTFSGGAFVLTSWGSTDRIVINGTAVANNLTGSNGRDVINAGDGADILSGSDGADQHNGGLADDRFTYATQSQITGDTIDGGAGTDELRTSSGLSTADFTSVSFAGTSGLSIERVTFVTNTAQNMIFNASQFGGTGIAEALNIVGDLGTETVTINNATSFSAADFTFLGWSSADRIVINGAASDDTLTGSIERDEINGGDGADVLFGSTGADRHSGGAASDTFIYQSQAQIDGDTIDGGAGFDVLRTAIGVASLDFTTATFAGTSGAAIDQLELFGGTGTQNVIFNASQFGGAGLSAGLTISGSSASETITINNATSFSAAGFMFTPGLWSVNDRVVINGASGDDSIIGSTQRDLITGGVGADTLAGGDGNDTLEGGAGADALDGGAGTADWASYFNAGGAVALYIGNPAANTGDAAGDTFANIEFFELTNGFADTFFGGSGRDVAFGQGGNDILFGNAGTDALYGQAGDDFLLGGDGADVLDGGTAGFDAVYYGDSATAVSINLATATHSGFAAGDTFVGIEGYLLTEAGDTMTGLDSPSLGELIYGLGGDDRLVGLGGFDWLLGGDGADTLTGGFGFDLLIGGAGADRFVYETGGQGGVGEGIADFQVGIDKLAFVTASKGITGLTLGQNLFIQNSNVTTITGSQGTGPGPTLIYDTSNGGLWYDANGNTAAGLIYLVGLSGTPVLTAADFIVL